MKVRVSSPSRTLERKTGQDDLFSDDIVFDHRGENITLLQQGSNSSVHGNVSMIAVLTGYFCVAVAFVLHVLWWRISYPKSTVFALSGIFIGVFLITIALEVVLFDNVTVWDFMFTAIIVLSTLACYLLIYIGIENDSPTLSIALFLISDGNHGKTKDEITSYFSTRPFVKTRVDQMFQDGFIYEKNGIIFIRRKSSFLLFLCEEYRKWMGKSKDGG